MVTTAMMCMEDGDRAREVFRNTQSDYHTSLVAKYLDSFPQTAGIDKVPTLKPPVPLEYVNRAIEARAVAVGTPDEAINTMRVYEEIGADQVSFGVLSDDTPFDAAIESVETFGKYVLPEFDKDPVCSTTRRSARRRWADGDHHRPGRPGGAGHRGHQGRGAGDRAAVGRRRRVGRGLLAQ